MPAEFQRWVWAGGRKLKGLVRRLEVEAALHAEGRCRTSPATGFGLGATSALACAA